MLDIPFPDKSFWAYIRRHYELLSRPRWDQPNSQFECSRSYWSSLDTARSRRRPVTLPIPSRSAQSSSHWSFAAIDDSY